MFRNKFRTFVSVIGSVTFVILALYGLAVIFSNATLALGAPFTLASRSRNSQADDLSIPLLINYQGTLRNPEGSPLSGYYTMTFRLYDDIIATPENAIWSEQHISVTVRSGHFSVLLGNTQPFSSTFFSNPDRFIGVTVNPYDEMVPRQRFASVPYAVYADRAFSLSAPDGEPSDAVYVDENGNTILTNYLELRDFDDDIVHDDAHVRAIARNGNWMFWNGGVVVGQFGDDKIGPVGTNNLVVTGTVGIGTANPERKLDVDGGSTMLSQYLELRDFDDNTEGPVRAVARDKNWMFPDSGVVIGQYSDGEINPVGTNNLVVKGNVGIGTTSPSAALDVNGDVRVSGNAPVIIKRFIDQGNNANFSTGIPSDEYECVAAGWLTNYDIQEDGARNSGVWTRVLDGEWWARVEFASHNVHERPDVDILCFRKEIVEWEGGSRGHNDAAGE